MSRMWVKIVAVFLLTTTSALGASTQPAPSTQKSIVVEDLIREGELALQGGDAKAARDAFDDATRLDPANVHATTGLALAYLKLGLGNRALKYLQPQVNRKPDRATVINYTAACVAAKTPMPGVKVMKDFLQNNAGDEEGINAMQIALNAADEHAKQSRLYEEANAFVQSYTLRLAAKHPGQKRWGIEWMPESQADAKAAQVVQAQQHVTTMRQELKVAEQKIVTLQDKIAATERRGHTLEELDRQKEALNNAEEDRDTKKKQLDRAIAAVPAPDIPGQISPVMPGLESVAQASEPVAIPASHTPIPSPPAAAVPNPVIPTSPPPRPPQPAQTGAISRHAVAFAVSENLVVSSADVVGGAKEIRVQSSDNTDVFSATIEKIDDTSGLALLKVDRAKLNALPIGSAFAGGAVTCVGFPEVSLFNTGAQLIAGSTKPTGVASFARHPRLAGAPLLAGGQVVGVALGSRDQDQTAISIATLQQLQQLMSDVPITAKPATDPRSAVMQLTAVRQSQ